MNRPFKTMDSATQLARLAGAIANTLEEIKEKNAPFDFEAFFLSVDAVKLANSLSHQIKALETLARALNEADESILRSVVIEFDGWCRCVFDNYTDNKRYHPRGEVLEQIDDWIHRWREFSTKAQQLTNEVKSEGSGSRSGGKGVRKKRKSNGPLGWVGEAIKFLKDDPSLYDKDIAEKVGRDPGTLSRNETYQTAAKEIRADARRERANARTDVTIDNEMPEINQSLDDTDDSESRRIRGSWDE